MIRLSHGITGHVSAADSRDDRTQDLQGIGQFPGNRRQNNQKKHQSGINTGHAKGDTLPVGRQWSIASRLMIYPDLQPPQLP